MKTVDDYIKFELLEKKPKTEVWKVINKQENFIIGIIKWYPSWRHYCFFPTSETVFSDRCLMRIGIFVKGKNLAHKSSKEVIA